LSAILTYKLVPPRKTSIGKSPAIVLLHGRGSDEDDLLGLSRYLDDRLLIASVRAPLEFEFGYGYTWFDLHEDGTADQKQYAESYARLVEFLDHLLKTQPVDPNRLFLCGFSMGTIMSYAIALTRPELIAGVIAYSGFIRELSTVQFSWDKIKEKPYFISHGLHDQVIPVGRARTSEQLLVKAGAIVEYHEYPMAHEINSQSLNDSSRWLTSRLEVKT